MSGESDQILQKYIDRLKNIPDFNIFSVSPDGATVAPWYKVEGNIVLDLVLTDATIAYQVQTVAAQVGHWGRLAANAKRVWQIEEHEYRIWRDKIILELVTPPSDPKEAKEWKKPTETVLEATYRSHKDYASYQRRIERAEEAFTATSAYLESFRVQARVIESYVRRINDQTIGLRV